MRKRLVFALVLLTGCGRTITAPCWQSVQADTVAVTPFVVTVAVRVPCNGH